MSSILVRGMEMPKCCYDCPLIRASVAGDFYCVAGDGIEEDLKKLYKHRMSDCPLTEVEEPHGKLIDVSKLNMYDVSPVRGFCVIGVTEEDIELADAVIEAEGSEE